MKKMLAILFSVLFTLPLAGCKDEKKILRINEVTHSVFYAPLYLAEALGYFAEEGIEIEITNGGGADNTMAAVLSGSADVGFCGPEAALYVLVGGSTDVPKVFGQLTKRDGSFLVSRVKEDNFTFENLRGKEILAGRRGGVPAMTFETVLKEHGLKDGVDLTLNYDVAFNLMTSAFESGVADYCTMFEPTASEYEKAGKGYIVASVGEASGEIPYTCFMAKESYITAHEEQIEGFLRAVTKSVKYVMEHDSKTLAPLLVSYFESTSLDSISTSLDSYKRIDAWMTNLTMEEKSFSRLQDVIENAGELARRVSLEELSVSAYSQKAYRDVYSEG